MKEVRDIKLDLLFGNDNEIINLFNEITYGIEIVNTNVYNEDGLEFIYHKDGEWIFYQDVKNGKFWCSNARYWTLFTNKFDLSYEEIQNITKFLVEEALKREVNTPVKLSYDRPGKVEEALKREVTPIGNFYIEPNLVQEVLKKEVNTPNRGKWEGEWEVQEALKREVSTPTYADGTVNVDLEETLKRELGTPFKMKYTPNQLVEEALEKEIKHSHELINPDVFPKRMLLSLPLIEEALNKINYE